MSDQIARIIRDQHAWHEREFKRSVACMDAALAFAVAAHADQQRKYTHDPYIVHPVNVALLVGEVFPDMEMVMAAYLHDTVEDCGADVTDIAGRFGPRVGRLVDGLTDKFTDHALGNRAARKRMERERLGRECSAVQTIKAADLCDNTCSIARYDPDFARVYLREKRDTLNEMYEAHPALKGLGYTLIQMNELSAQVPPRIEGRGVNV